MRLTMACSGRRFAPPLMRGVSRPSAARMRSAAIEGYTRVFGLNSCFHLRGMWPFFPAGSSAPPGGVERKLCAVLDKEAKP